MKLPAARSVRAAPLPPERRERAGGRHLPAAHRQLQREARGRADRRAAENLKRARRRRRCSCRSAGRSRRRSAPSNSRARTPGTRVWRRWSARRSARGSSRARPLRARAPTRPTSRPHPPRTPSSSSSPRSLAAGGDCAARATRKPARAGQSPPQPHRTSARGSCPRRARTGSSGSRRRPRSAPSNPPKPHAEDAGAGEQRDAVVARVGHGHAAGGIDDDALGRREPARRARARTSRRPCTSRRGSWSGRRRRRCRRRRRDAARAGADRPREHERPGGRELLDAPVAGVGDVHAAGRVDRDPGGRVELALAGPGRSPTRPRTLPPRCTCARGCPRGSTTYTFPPLSVATPCAVGPTNHAVTNVPVEVNFCTRATSGVLSVT